MDVEKLAVAHVESIIAKCSRVQSFITTGDKVPFTDGHIDVYASMTLKKEDWLGKVDVQVKGRTTSRMPEESPSFRVSRTDMLGYQKDGGVLFFLVLIHEDGQPSAAYYALLEPFAIANYLGQVPEKQKSISVPFKRFPSAELEIDRILALCLKTQSHHMATGFDPVLFKNAKSINIHTVNGLDLTKPIHLSPNNFDYSADLVTDGGLTVPLNGELRIFPPGYTERALNATIRVGEIAYEHGTVRNIDHETTEIALGDGLTLTMRRGVERSNANINLSLPGNFDARLKAIEFFIGIADGGRVQVNEKNLGEGFSLAKKSAGLGGLRRQLGELLQVNELLEHLGVNTSLIELETVKARHFQNLLRMNRTLVHREEFMDSRAELARAVLDVGDWLLMLLIVPGTGTDMWRYVSPFDSTHPQAFRWSATGASDETIPVTAYDLVDSKLFPRVLNLHLDAIVDAYEGIADGAQTFSLANQRVLELIRAADKIDQRKDEFLQGAFRLNDWLISHEGATDVHRINRWQILHRQSALRLKHYDEIRSLKRNLAKSGEDHALQAELCCALLLGDQDDINYLSRQLPADDLTTIRQWPIWNLRGAREGAVE